MESFGNFFDTDVSGRELRPEEEPLLSNSELLENGELLPTATGVNGHAIKSHDELPVFDNIHAYVHSSCRSATNIYHSLT